MNKFLRNIWRWSVLLLVLQRFIYAEEVHKVWESALSMIQQGKYEEGWKQFEKMIINNPKDPEILFAGGCLQYQQAEKLLQAKQMEEAKKTLKEAQNHFEQASLVSVNNEMRAKALYNKANSQLLLVSMSQSDPQSNAEIIPNLESAIISYREALELNPNLTSAQKNLDYANYLLKQLKKEKKENQQQQKEEQQSKDEQSQQWLTMFTDIQTELPNAKIEILEDHPNVLELKK